MGFFDKFKGKTQASNSLEQTEAEKKLLAKEEELKNLTPDKNETNNSTFIAESVNKLSPEGNKDVTVVMKDEEHIDHVEVENVDPIDKEKPENINEIAQEIKKPEDVEKVVKRERKSPATTKVEIKVDSEIAEKRRRVLMDLKVPELNTEEDIKKEINNLSVIRTSWRDYTLMMLNSTADPLRSIWREKITTSLTHWTMDKGSISEGNIDGMEILTVLPSELTLKLVDDYFEEGELVKLNRLSGSKRMNVHIGHYPQESTSNEANICLKYLVKNWDNTIYTERIKGIDGNDDTIITHTGKSLIVDTPLLYRMWNLAQKTGGKCVSGDEVLTYNLEKPLDDSHFGVWMDVTEDVAENGRPSDKYADYWKLDKIEGYPLAEQKEMFSWTYTQGAVDAGIVESIREVSLEEQKENFLKMCDLVLREDINMCCCWKKIAICILKNDVSMKYAGFSATLRERKAREDAMAAFSTKQEEKQKAKAEAKALAKKIEKENQQNNN